LALVPLSKLLADARADGYAVGYFEAWDMYSLEAVVRAAEAERSPVVLGFGGMTVDQDWIDQSGIELLGAYGRCAAQRAAVPAAFILNEVRELVHALRGIDAGYNTVMLDTSELPYQRNVELTRAVVVAAHPKGVEVQAELGRLPSAGSDDPGELTDPHEARDFVTETGVGFLAVSIGNVHLRTDGAAGVDIERLRAIRDRVHVPLVIHGGSGLSEEAVAALVREGVALFHVGTVLKRRFLERTRETLGTLEEAPDYQATVGSRKPSDFLMPGAAAVAETVRAMMRLYGSSGRAG